MEDLIRIDKTLQVSNIGDLARQKNFRLKVLYQKVLMFGKLPFGQFLSFFGPWNFKFSLVFPPEV